jgi:predicted permease
MQTLWQDLRYGARMLLKKPGFTLIAVITLALGIGANTAIFTVLNAVLLRALPVQDPQQLVILSNPDSQGMSAGLFTGERFSFAFHEFEELRDRNQVFSGVFAVSGWHSTQRASVEGVSQSIEAEPARISMVSGGYFTVLGVNAVRGRMFTAEVDKVKAGTPVAVISYDFWKNRCALDPAVIGRKLRLRRTTVEIIGVAPAGFFGETVGWSPDIWVPLTMQPLVAPMWEDFLARPKDMKHKVLWLRVMARLKPGMTLQQAQAGVNLTFQQMLQSEADEQIAAYQRRAYLNQYIQLRDGGRGASVLQAPYGEPLMILMGMVGLVLLITCANVANFLLAHATARQREMAVRAALGAGRRRLMRQSMTESMLLALAGGATGLLLALWADAILLRLVSWDSAPIPLDLRPDARVLGFTLGVSLLTGILFGLAPAFRAARVDLIATLKGAAKGISGGVRGGRTATGKLLVVAQVALSLVLLIAAGLFVRSFQKLMRLDPGYDRDHLMLVDVNPELSDYPGDALKRLDQRLLERLQAIPGVSGATLSSRGLFDYREVNMIVWLEGEAPPSPGEGLTPAFDYVGPRYFSTLGMTLLAGREIGPQDEGNAPRVGVINQAMARAYFGDANPIGRRLMADRDSPFEITVVGVVADAKYNHLREQTPSQCYLAYFNSNSQAPRPTFEIRSSANVAMASAIRAAIKEVAPSLPAPEIRAMNEVMAQSLTTERAITQLSSFFGLLALLLACIGLYGLMSYNVASRSNELGIRIALGARPRDILKLVAGQGMTLVLIGVVAGLLAAFALTRLISSLLYEVSATDGATFVVIALLLAGVALLACWIPARRATKVDPMIALRCE